MGDMGLVMGGVCVCVCLCAHTRLHTYNPGLGFPAHRRGHSPSPRRGALPATPPTSSTAPCPEPVARVPAPASPSPPPRGVRIALMHFQGPAWAQSSEEQRAMTEAGQLAKGESFVPAPPGLLLSPSPPPALSAQGAIFQRPPPPGLVTQVPLAASVSRAPQSLRHF